MSSVVKVLSEVQAIEDAYYALTVLDGVASPPHGVATSLEVQGATYCRCLELVQQGGLKVLSEWVLREEWWQHSKYGALVHKIMDVIARVPFQELGSSAEERRKKIDQVLKGSQILPRLKGVIHKHPLQGRDQQLEDRRRALKERIRKSRESQ